MEGISPALAAPGSNSYGNGNRSTGLTDGRSRRENQALSKEDADNLCLRYRPLALKIAGQYRGKGVELDDLRSAGFTGLVLATKKFDPDRGVAFGGYAKFWIKGQILELFTPKADALGFGRSISLDAPIKVNSDDGEPPPVLLDLVADASAPAIAPDLSALSERDRYIVEARDSGETFAEVGLKLGLSSERVRQREVRARSQIKGAVASACISDLTNCGDVIKHPNSHARRMAEFRDKEPPQHVYCEPKPSRQLAHHRANACRLAELRGNAVIRNALGTCGGPSSTDGDAHDPSIMARR